MSIGESRAAARGPTGQACGDTEAAPGQQVAGRKQGRRRIRLSVGAAAPVYGGEDEDHRRRAGQHHAGHHDPPHQEQQDEVDGAFRLHRHGHGHVAHRPHVRRSDEQVEPAERGEAAERRRDHDALAQHQVEQWRGGWGPGGGAGSPRAIRPPRQKARSGRCCPCQKAEGEPEALHLRLLGARQGEPAVGRVGGVVDIEGLAGTVARGHAFDLEGKDARDLGGAAQAFDGEVDAGYSTPRKSLTRLSRIICGGPPDCRWRCRPGPGAGLRSLFRRRRRRTPSRRPT